MIGFLWGTPIITADGNELYNFKDSYLEGEIKLNSATGNWQPNYAKRKTSYFKR